MIFIFFNDSLNAKYKTLEIIFNFLFILYVIMNWNVSFYICSQNRVSLTYFKRDSRIRYRSKNGHRRHSDRLPIRNRVYLSRLILVLKVVTRVRVVSIIKIVDVVTTKTDRWDTRAASSRIVVVRNWKRIDHSCSFSHSGGQSVRR